jgi:hypothetical protein
MRRLPKTAPQHPHHKLLLNTRSRSHAMKGATISSTGRDYSVKDWLPHLQDSIRRGQADLSLNPSVTFITVSIPAEMFP